MPIIYDESVIGVIDAEHESKNYFTIEHVNTIERIANLVSLQLKNAINLRERIQIENKNIELVGKLSKSNEYRLMLLIPTIFFAMKLKDFSLYAFLFVIALLLI